MLGTIGDLLEDVIDSSWPLTEYKQAEARLESNDFLGKIVVVP